MPLRSLCLGLFLSGLLLSSVLLTGLAAAPLWASDACQV